MPDLGYYLGLVTAWHSDKPRFMNTLASLLMPVIEAQSLIESLTADFDLDTAIGIQLDQVGQWIGRDRYIREPIEGVFFSFDDGGGPRTGFDQGIWLGPYDPTDKIAAMDDETYRMVLKLQAIANQWDATVPSIVEAFNRVFPGVVIDDRGDKAGGLMAMDVLIPSPEISSLLLAILEQDFPIKPSGVRLTIIETTILTDPLFGFDIEGEIIAGFDEGAWGKIILQT